MRRLFAAGGSEEDIPDGAVVAGQGAPVTRLHLVVAGRAMAFRRLDGREVPVADLSAGTLIGLEGVCGTGRHAVTVEALGGLRLVGLERAAFLDRIRADPLAGLAAFAALSGRLRDCIASVDDLRFRSATTRVARYLWDCLDSPPGCGPARGRLPCSKKRVATHLGITQQSLSRVLRRLAEAGVTATGAVIEVADPAALAALAEVEAVP
jgi:CRP-like cAMP-binding protein